MQKRIDGEYRLDASRGERMCVRVEMCTCVACRAAVGLQAGVERWSVVWRSLSTSICLLDYLGCISCADADLAWLPPLCPTPPVPPKVRPAAAWPRPLFTGNVPQQRERPLPAVADVDGMRTPPVEEVLEAFREQKTAAGGLGVRPTSAAAGGRVQGAKAAAGGLGVSMRAGCVRRD